jgi:NAD(P)-dependent dehydrogenase (short-subunit alcohol dehydrogenase family)
LKIQTSARGETPESASVTSATSPTNQLGGYDRPDTDEEQAMNLKDKVAVIYGAAGGIGAAVARAFAQEGAKVFLTGRQREAVEEIATDIQSAGGSARAMEVDALDEQAVDKHLQSVIDMTGRVDISFNAVGIPNAKALGVPMVDLDLKQFSQPILDYTTSYFLTARLAARRMIPKKSGVIMTVTALLGRTGTLLNGGHGSAQAAKEALTRDLSTELAPQGIRVVNLRPHGMPETRTMREAFELKASRAGMTWEQFQTFLANWSNPKRVMKLEEVANMAAFIASDKASGMTGTTVNLTMGGVLD